MPPVRRLAAILAADVAGYSRLMGVDEEGTHERLQGHLREVVNPKVEEHRGRIVKNTGDGFLVEFASVVDAVRCAMEFQRGMADRNADTPPEKRIEFRIGINLGDVIAEEDDIYGDGVNIAARLEGLAEPGGICVSRMVRDNVRDKLDYAFEDLGEQQVKNITRPMRAYRVGDRSPSIERLLAVSPPPLPLPDKPSIAVMPFENMSGDTEQEYFADGMVEEIITTLSCIRWLFVIARNSSFTYKGRSIDVKQVGRELGVRYVLQGSVRKAEGRVRITAQLIDAQNSAHLWADRFDGSLDDIFDLQDRVASSVIGAIEPKLRQSEIERARRKPTASLNAYDLYLRALAKFHEFTKEGCSEAIRLAQQALDIDPSYAPAAALIGYSYHMQVLQRWAPSEPARLAEIAGLARRAVQSGKEDPDALWMAGFVMAFTGDVKTGANVVDRALSLNPNSAHAWMVRGWIYAFLSQPKPAFEALQRAIRLSPLDPLCYDMMWGLGHAALAGGRYEEAIEWADRCRLEEPTYRPAYTVKLAACSALNKTAETKEAAARLLELQPGYTISSYQATASRFVSPEVVALVVEGLRKAGVPEE
jgi:adenylate cyclase